MQLIGRVFTQQHPTKTLYLGVLLHVFEWYKCYTVHTRYTWSTKWLLGGKELPGTAIAVACPFFLQEACANVCSRVGLEATDHFAINCIAFQQCHGYDLVTLKVTDLNGVGVMKTVYCTATYMPLLWKFQSSIAHAMHTGARWMLHYCYTVVMQIILLRTN